MNKYNLKEQSNLNNCHQSEIGFKNTEVTPFDEIEVETPKRFNYKNFPRIFKKYLIYTLMNLFAMIHEISYITPRRVTIYVKNTDQTFEFIDRISQITTEMIYFFFFEYFQSIFTGFTLMYFIWSNLKNYPRIQKFLLLLVFATVSTITSPVSLFPYIHASVARTQALLMFLVLSLFLISFINKNNEIKKPKLITTIMKSIFFAILISILTGGLFVFTLILNSSSAVDYFTKENPEALQKLENFCMESKFDISDIYITKDSCISNLIFTVLLIFNNSIFISSDFIKCFSLDSLVSVLYHEVAHTYITMNVLRLFILCMISFSVFFIVDRMIGPNLNTYKLYDFVEKGILLSIIINAIEYIGNIINSRVEFACDENATSTPENAFNLLVFFLEITIADLKSQNFRSSGFTYRSCSFFYSHPSVLDRIMRIEQKYPELLKIELDYSLD